MKQAFFFSLIIWVLTPSLLRAQSENPLTGYSGYTNSYFLNYVNDPGFGTATPDDPLVSLSIGGGLYRAPRYGLPRPLFQRRHSGGASAN